ncbi:hypothetical protein Gohar_003946 [Gossypium harknessii]|uniref:Dynamin N-terminal domain-containing protein n=1 Tax=Gossypium harknessii TaxID=34285 RepID=A0A7J9H422_9ROSI|nr:hypothetical protein [Gossypium harknessii]
MVLRRSMASSFTCLQIGRLRQISIDCRLRQIGRLEETKVCQTSKFDLRFSPQMFLISLLWIFLESQRFLWVTSPQTLKARIRTMIMSYIKQPSCLILAVTPANSDLANSDALQIAGNADPDGLSCFWFLISWI